MESFGPTSSPVTVIVDRSTLKLVTGSESFTVPFDLAAYGEEWEPGDARLLRAQGQALWRAAFSGALGAALDQAAARITASGRHVTVRIVPDPDLPTSLRWLPWELLFDSAQRDFLALKSGWSVVRSTARSQVSRPFDTGRLSVVVVDLPMPNGMSYPAAEVEIDAILNYVGERGEVSVVKGGGASATLEAIDRASIVHVIQGSPSYANDQLVNRALVTGRAALVVLSSCDSEAIAETIADNTGAAVLAHRQQVTDAHAAAFTEAFYRALVQGLSVDIAVTEARRTLDRRFPGDLAWASAVLLTGWPPPALPMQFREESKFTEAHAPPAEEPAALAEMLHSRNIERARELLQATRWAPLEHQLDTANRRLDELRERDS